MRRTIRSSAGRPLLALLAALVLAVVVPPVASAQAPGPVPIVRIAGGNRIESAIRLSQAAFSRPPVSHVLLTRADSFPDALAAGPLAGELGAPILLTHGDSLPLVVVNEIRRLAPETIILLGGEEALSDTVAEAAAGLAEAVERMAGATRFDTARRIADRTDGNDAVIASGLNFPDALSAGSLAPSDVLLTQPDRLSFDPAGLGQLTIVGGSKAIAGGIIEAPRLAGPTRYDTNLAVLRAAMTRRGGQLQLFVTTGENYPDALAASALTQPILLVHPAWQGLPAPVSDFLRSNRDRFTAVFVIGGQAAVPATVQQAVSGALTGSLPG